MKIVNVIYLSTVVCCSLSVFFALVSFFLLVPVTVKPDLPGYCSTGIFFR